MSTFEENAAGNNVRRKHASSEDATSRNARTEHSAREHRIKESAQRERTAGKNVRSERLAREQTKRKLVIPVAIVSGLIVVWLGISVLIFAPDLIYIFSPFRGNPYESPPTGERDREGSWAQISQPITKGPDWQQIVYNSPFQLGEKTIAGYQNTLNGNQEAYYNIGFGTYPGIDGSTVAVPMAIEFAWQHLGLWDIEASMFVGFSTTHKAYMNLITQRPTFAGSIFYSTHLERDHPVDLIIVTEPSLEELEAAQRQGVTLVQKPVCYDAFVFITHKDNPVNSLTIQQIQDIYSGRITNWKEVGGRDEPITAYQREPNSGSQTAMENLVMQGRPMLPPETVKVIEGMGPLVNAVAEYNNNTASIGYTYKYYIDTLYKNEDIKVLGVEGIYPDEIRIRAGTYPFTTCYYGVIRGGEESATGGLFLDWMLSIEGQQCIKQAGYIPYLDI